MDIMFYIIRFKNNGYMNVLLIVVIELNIWFCIVSIGCVIYIFFCRFIIYVWGILIMFSILMFKVFGGIYIGIVGIKIFWFIFYKE